MGKRYVSGVLMTTAVLLRSGMKENFHVPFWRAVEEVTLSLTLIVRDAGLALLRLGGSSSQLPVKSQPIDGV